MLFFEVSISLDENLICNLKKLIGQFQYISGQIGHSLLPFFLLWRAHFFFWTAEHIRVTLLVFLFHAISQFALTASFNNWIIQDHSKHPFYNTVVMCYNSVDVIPELLNR